MKGPNRYRKPGRRAPFRDPRPLLLIVCEGAVTERQYFETFALHYKNALIRVKLAEKTGVPFTLVKAAKQYKIESDLAAKSQGDQNLAFDHVWCVFDIDEHPHVHEAREMAKANQISLAISNPCFELWLVLHLRESPGMKHRQAMQNLLKSLKADYDKHVDFAQYAKGYPDAVARAKKLDALDREVSEHGRNPSTNVYELTEFILRGGEDDKSAG